jgi:hypothetical protein
MTSPDDTEPSAEADEVAMQVMLRRRSHADAEWLHREFALALDRFRAAGVREERERCLRVLKLNNDNDAHRYYIEHPEFFK